MKEQRYDVVVYTGRFKIIDHHQGQQIATADDEESARIIVRSLNTHAQLVEALRDIQTNATTLNDAIAKARIALAAGERGDAAIEGERPKVYKIGYVDWEAEKELQP